MESILLAAEAAGTAAIAAGSIPEAMEMAMEQARLQGADGSRIVVSGSVYLVGEARSWLFSECGVER
jgi:folylpolyglutamate synthase/dihydropteroate synthase